MKVALTIDGQIIHVEQHTPILDAAKKLGIFIPTLCYHEALKPFGACRLCMVEVIQNKRSMLVTSCSYPAENGLEVLTASDRVKRIRKMVVESLLARCPNVPLIQDLAYETGIKRARFKKKDDLRCILCGLCVRACEEIVGVSAIGFVNRGTEREVNTPFGIDSDVCIGCGTCTYICPTGCIEMATGPGSPGYRSLNMGDLALDPCPNNYQCEACEIEHGFFQEMKRVIEDVRGKGA